jgi:predicted DNA-binding transcriptional regulator YafY
MSMHQLHWKGSARTIERQVELRATPVLPPLWHLVASDPTCEGFRHFRMDLISRPTSSSERRSDRGRSVSTTALNPFDEPAPV